MRYIECSIIYVDPSRFMLDCISIDQLNYFTDVSYMTAGMKAAGDILHPQHGDVCICNLIEDGVVEFIKYYSTRSIDSNGLPTNLVGQSVQGDTIPGDRNITGPDGAFLRLLRGGLATIGASPLAQTVYLAMEGMVRTIAQNYELISSGSRIYSINSDGNIITRMCFNSSDKFFSEGANDNEGAEAENFEYQIDISSAGMSFYIGSIGDDGKRVNNLIINLKQVGDIQVLCGNNIILDIYSNGGYSFKMVDDSNNVVYNKTVATAGGNTLLKEIITGDVVRYIDGNCYEEITGIHDVKANIATLNAVIVDHNGMLKRNSVNLNIEEIATAPVSGMTLK